MMVFRPEFIGNSVGFLVVWVYVYFDIVDLEIIK